MKKETKKLLDDVDKKAEENESKHAKSVRIVVKRVRNALKALRLIGNCSTNDYELTPQEVDNIKTIITKTLENVMGRFEGKTKNNNEFTL